MIKSNLLILMAQKNIRKINILQEQTGLSWDIFNKLLNNENIESIRFGNLIKICKVLECDIEELIDIKYPYKTRELINRTNGPSNMKILMLLNNIETINDLIKKANISWGITKKIQDGCIDTIELGSLISVCFALNTRIEDLLNIKNKS